MKNASPYVNCWVCIGPTNILGYNESYNSFGCPLQVGSERDINMDNVGATVQCVESGSGQGSLFTWPIFQFDWPMYGLI